MIIWQSTLDGKYVCSVEKTGEYQGKLIIVDKNVVLYSSPVILSYDAKFGSDMADVEAWQSICLEFVDCYSRGAKYQG